MELGRVFLVTIPVGAMSYTRLLKALELRVGVLNLGLLAFLVRRKHKTLNTLEICGALLGHRLFHYF